MQELTVSNTPTSKPIKKLANGAFIMNECTRCGHKWIQRKKGGRSIKCPACKSKYWYRQYERPQSVERIKAWYEEKRKEVAAAIEVKEKEKTAKPNP